MVPCRYTDNDGVERLFDLSAAIRVVDGSSAKRSGWSATIVFDPVSRALIEQRSAAPDVRGNAEGQAEQVSPTYVLENFAISKYQLVNFQGVEPNNSFKPKPLRGSA